MRACSIFLFIPKNNSTADIVAHIKLIKQFITLVVSCATYALSPTDKTLFTELKTITGILNKINRALYALYFSL
jgi:hypothetical protein